MSLAQKHKEDFINLIEAGYIACNQADEDAAKKLFKAASILKPEDPLAKIGIGYMHMLKFEIQKAVDCFKEVLKKDPENEMAQAMLGMTMAFGAVDMLKAEDLLKAASKADDKSVSQLADQAMEFVEQFLKKAPGTPAAGMQAGQKPKKDTKK